VDQALDFLGKRNSVYHITLDAHLEVVAERARKRGYLGRHGKEGVTAWLDLVHGNLGTGQP
jgi:hypothetical protein